MERYLEKGGKGSKRTNIVVIPGFSGQSLVDQTCNHFVKWLRRVFENYTTPTTVWIFQHRINIDGLASWDEYPYAGESLLHQLKEMYIDEDSSEEDSLILIGHKLGGFILKKALIDADRKAHHSYEKKILESLDCLLMLGDPNLHRDNRSDWINLISGCLSSTKPLPQRLSVDESVQCLQAISSKFEDFRLNSWLFQISGKDEVKRKSVLRFKRHVKGEGCIRSATIAVRMWSTQEPEKQVPEGKGHTNCCTFMFGSTHYENLLNAVDENLELKYLPFTGPTSDMANHIISNAYPTDSDVSLDSVSGDIPNAPHLALGAVSIINTDPSLLDPVDVKIEPQSGFLRDDQENSSKASTGSLIRVNSMDCPPQSDVSISEVTQTSIRECPEISSTILAGSEQDPESMDIASLQFQKPDFDCHASSCNRSLVTAQSVPLPASKVKLPYRYKIPEHLNRPFFGRENILSRLESFFSIEDDSISESHPMSPRQFTLSGLGGCGKTQIALQYVYRNSQSFDAILWFRSDTDANLAQDCHAAAQELGLVEYQIKHDHTESRQKLLWWLETAHRPFLLIFDNAENYAMLKRYIPYSSQGQIIITCRNSFYGSQDQDESIKLAAEEIGPLPTDEAVSFLNSLVPQAIEEADPAAPIVIAEQLGNLPLALDHCANYIAQRQLTFREFAIILAERRAFNELPTQLGIKIIDVRLRRTESPDLANYCSKIHWRDFSKPAASMMSVLCFLDSEQISESILLRAIMDNGLPSRGFPRSDGAYSLARSELLMHDCCNRSKSKRSLYTQTLVTDNMRASMGPALFETGFKTTCRLLIKTWPSRRKLPNVLRSSWSEFDALHTHVCKLTKIYNDCVPSNTPDSSNILTGPRYWSRFWTLQKPIQNLQQSLVSDDFVRLLVYSTWYNAYRGNADEDNSLLSTACEILQGSSLRSSDGRALGDPYMCTSGATDLLDNVFNQVLQEPEIVFLNQLDLSEDSLDTGIFRADILAQNQTNDSKLRLDSPLANGKHLQAADTESCESMLKQGLELAYENRAIEALAKLQQAKDTISVFRQPTEASVLLFISASLYQGHLYLTQGLSEAASAAFDAVRKCSEEYEALMTDQLLLGRLEFGLASIEPEASEVKIQHYNRALEFFDTTKQLDTTETNDWIAVTQLKLSDAHLMANPKDIPAAVTSIQKALDHFQAQKTTSAHFHTARALYKRASIFEAEGNSMMKMAFQAAAQELWTQSRGADAAVVRSLVLQDFDERIVEPWFK